MRVQSDMAALPNQINEPTPILQISTELCPHCRAERKHVGRRHIGIARNYGPGPWQVTWACGSYAIFGARPTLNLSRECTKLDV